MLVINIFYPFLLQKAQGAGFGFRTQEEIASFDSGSPFAGQMFSPNFLYVGTNGQTVQGDNLYASFTGTGGSALEPSLLSIQETALLGVSSPLTIAASANQRSGAIKYSVETGDTPSAIAASFGITLNTLLWANNLREGAYIRPGDELVVLPTNGVLYKVKTGDTISSIAKRFKGNEDEIIAYNGLGEGAEIHGGDYVLIPDGEMPRSNNIVRGPSYAYSGKDLGGYFIRPASGRITQGLHPTNAVDVANACWTPVYAVAGASVSISDGYGWNGGYGKYVRLRHPNGVETVYSHLVSVIVSVSQQVEQGQIVGYMGSTGRSTGCHVHFEVWGAKNPLGGMRLGQNV